jgi:crossover junction endodeoxyribonuclease RuvC
MTRILGIDPGLTRCGIGIIELGKGRKVSLVHVGVLVSPKDQELDARIGSVGSEIDALIKKFKPDVIAIERVFSQANLASVMGTAQISGVAIFLAYKHSIPVAMHTPTEVKAAVTGSGRAAKAQVGIMVAKLLGLTEIPKPADAADALAIAICQGYRGVNSSSSYTKAQLKWHSAVKSASGKTKR